MRKLATIQSQIQLYDAFSGPMMSVINAVNMGVSAMAQMQDAVNAPVDFSMGDEITDQMNQAMQAIEEAREKLTEPIQNPSFLVRWDSSTLPTFTSTGIERFEQEVQSTNAMLDKLRSTQADIANLANRTNIFPANMVSDMNTMQARIQGIQERIQAIESNPLNMGTDQVNNELEQLRGQLDQAVQEQNQLNETV